MAFTLAKNGLVQPLSAWGIEATSLVLSLRSFTADELAFSVSCSDAFAPASFAFGDLIFLYQDGFCIFSGRIRQRPAFGGPTERQSYIAYNFWYEMEQLIYEQQRNVIDAVFATLSLIATTQIVFGRDTATGAKINTLTQIQNLATFANANGVPLFADISFTGLVAPWEQANDVSVAAGIRRMAAWQPDIFARTDYGLGTPILRMRRPNTDDVVIFDLTAGDKLLSIQCQRRDDLVPKGVVFNFLTTEIDPATGASYVRVQTQFGGSIFSGPGVIKGTIPIGSAEVVPPNLAYNYYTSLSTVFLQGQLVIKGVEVSQSIQVGALLYFSHGSPEWESSFAPVTEVIHQLAAGTTTINFGPPASLPAATFAALNAKLKDRPNPPPPPKDPGAPAGGGGPTGGTAGDADTGRSGGGGPSSGSTFPADFCEGGVTKPRHVVGS